MPYSADGFDFFYTHRGSWKAERRRAGRLIDVVPVTWTKGRCERDGTVYQEVWFGNSGEMEAHRKSTDRFIVVVALGPTTTTCFPIRRRTSRAFLRFKPPGSPLAKTVSKRT